jgi:hypothetical protein
MPAKYGNANNNAMIDINGKGWMKRLRSQEQWTQYTR